MQLRGRLRKLKFRIGLGGNPAYDALKNSASCCIWSEDTYNCFEEYFVVVEFEDFGRTPFNPADYTSDPRDQGSAETSREPAEGGGEPEGS
ncbi:MAG: hypothetical protein ABFE07_27975 [Armatimonadia bacterium]